MTVQELEIKLDDLLGLLDASSAASDAITTKYSSEKFLELIEEYFQTMSFGQIIRHFISKKKQEVQSRKEFRLKPFPKINGELISTDPREVEYYDGELEDEDFHGCWNSDTLPIESLGATMNAASETTVMHNIVFFTVLSIIEGFFCFTEQGKGKEKVTVPFLEDVNVLDFLEDRSIFLNFFNDPRSFYIVKTNRNFLKLKFFSSINYDEPGLDIVAQMKDSKPGPKNSTTSKLRRVLIVMLAVEKELFRDLPYSTLKEKLYQREFHDYSREDDFEDLFQGICKSFRIKKSLS